MSTLGPTWARTVFSDGQVPQSGELSGVAALYLTPQSWIEGWNAEYRRRLAVGSDELLLCLRRLREMALLLRGPHGPSTVGHALARARTIADLDWILAQRRYGTFGAALPRLSGDSADTATAQPLITRRRMPRRRQGYTTSVSISGADFYLTANPNEDGTLGEVFIKFGKQGSTLGGLLDAVSISVSIGLQSGVPLETFVSKYINMRFEPFGMTDDPDLTTVASVLDYVFRRLALDFLDEEARDRLRIYNLDEESRQLTLEGSLR